jgi:hypothetical protein
MLENFDFFIVALAPTLRSAQNLYKNSFNIPTRHIWNSSGNVPATLSLISAKICYKFVKSSHVILTVLLISFLEITFLKGTSLWRVLMWSPKMHRVWVFSKSLCSKAHLCVIKPTLKWSSKKHRVKVFLESLFSKARLCDQLSYGHRNSVGYKYPRNHYIRKHFCATSSHMVIEKTEGMTASVIQWLSIHVNHIE